MTYTRIRKTDETGVDAVLRLSATVYEGPLTGVSTYMPAYPHKGTVKCVMDDPHNWPPRKGDYVGGDLFVEKKSYQCGNDYGFYASEPTYRWGPSSVEGPLVALFDNTGYLSQVPAYVDSDAQAMKTQVVNQVFSKAYSSKATLLVTAGEIHKTIGMVKRPFGQARNLLDQMTRRYRSLLKRGVDVSNAAASAWLEYRMGWKPVLYDLQNVAKAVEKQLTKTDFEFDQTYRSSISQSWGGGGEKQGTGFGVSKLGWSASIQRKHSAGVILRENLYDEASRPWQSIFGVQLHDVAPAVWELMPYSFVVDRFLDVQTWLEAIQPRPNTKVMLSWQTTTESKSEAVSCIESKLMIGGEVPRPIIPNPGSSYTCESTSVNRKVGVAPSIAPALNTRDLNLNQHLDHASLLIKQMLGLFPEASRASFGKQPAVKFRQVQTRKR